MFESEIVEDRGVQVVAISGPVDSATLDDFRKAIEPVSRQKRGRVVIDCSGLTYMNSRALGLLSSYRRRIYSGGGRLALCGVDKKMVRSFDLLGLGKVLKSYETREDAVESLQ